ncbi:FMN-binding negative transcriptional regulator [Ilyomonas limi]|uniref:FMN-binding negative transcriptional regulator n=1 Tax=Ilyomonas limi TaxID=2575867 RepID=A0A4U3KYN7_9BACT|nr:FMN-binding negative transcriptional regulator [Ilyomonas limi]TKK67775.1 FMN-binding negative transcriptional regulator [Ilyomonas limi]
MYIPNSNLLTDKTEAVAFMKRFSFATIITAKNSLPIATHLPFLVTIQDDNIVLTSHFAKANDQWKDIENNKILVIFSEPHAYISPKHYDKELNVPTWNYISVHAYGRGELITETSKVFEILERTIDNYEIEYKHQWNNLPDYYKAGLSKGIVAFDMVVTELQGKKKLSQNKTENERKKIINALSKSEPTNEQLIAEYMKNNQHRS